MQLLPMPPPAPPPLTVKVVPVTVLHIVSVGRGVRVDEVARVALDVGVDDGDHLPAPRGDVTDHLLRGGELVAVPREVPGGGGGGRNRAISEQLTNIMSISSS